MSGLKHRQMLVIFFGKIILRFYILIYHLQKEPIPTQKKKHLSDQNRSQYFGICICCHSQTFEVKNELNYSLLYNRSWEKDVN